jgi:hypothetical protein
MIQGGDSCRDLVEGMAFGESVGAPYVVGNSEGAGSCAYATSVFEGINGLGSVACCRYHCASDGFQLFGGVLLGTSNDGLLF